MTTDAVAGRPSIPSIVPVLNPLIRRLLRVGVPMGPNALVTIRGRRSGEPRTFPASVMEVGDRRYLVASFGETNWVRNLRVSGEATIRRGRTTDTFRATEVPADAAAAVLRDALARFLRSPFTSPLLTRWYGLSRSSTDSDYQHAALVHPVFELVAADTKP
jgi:deazaflavin-dependent oxidoreductase (nitroreductase family)